METYPQENSETSAAVLAADMPTTVLPPLPQETDAPLVVLAAAKLGATRLIDNLEI